MSERAPTTAQGEAGTPAGSTPDALVALLRQVIVLADASARRLGEGDHGARDIALRVATTFWEGRGQPGGYDSTRPLEPYVNRCVLNVLRKDERDDDARDERAARFQREFSAVNDVWMDPEAGVSQWDVERLYLRTLQRLPRVCREVFVRSRHERVSDAEIARERGISPATVRVHRRNAGLLLRDALHNHMKEGR